MLRRFASGNVRLGYFLRIPCSAIVHRGVIGCQVGMAIPVIIKLSVSFRLPSNDWAMRSTACLSLLEPDGATQVDAFNRNIYQNVAVA